jgi:hypothetical protein
MTLKFSRRLVLTSRINLILARAEAKPVRNQEPGGRLPAAEPYAAHRAPVIIIEHGIYFGNRLRNQFSTSHVVDCSDGREMGTGVVNYPGGENGILVDDNLARQHPPDYLIGLEQSDGKRLRVRFGVRRVLSREGRQNPRGHHGVRVRCRWTGTTCRLDYRASGKAILTRSAGF